MTTVIQPEDVQVGDTLRVYEDFTVTSVCGDKYAYTDRNGKAYEFEFTPESKIHLLIRPVTIPLHANLVTWSSEYEGNDSFARRNADGSWTTSTGFSYADDKALERSMSHDTANVQFYVGAK